MATERVSRFVRRLGLAQLLYLVALGAAAPAPAFVLRGSDGVGAPGDLRPGAVLPYRFNHWDLRRYPGCRVPWLFEDAWATSVCGVPMTEASAAIEQAFLRWADVRPQQLGFNRRPDASTLAWGNDGRNTVCFAYAPDVFGATPSAVLGITLINFNLATGEINDADIVLNTEFGWSLGGGDLRSVRTANAEPFALADGATIQIRVDSAATYIAAIHGTTAQDVADAINAVAYRPLYQNNNAIATALADGRVRIVSANSACGGWIEVLGGTAAPALGFPAGAFHTRVADIQSVALHEIGHFCGLGHSSTDPNEADATRRNAVMYYATPDTGSRRFLTEDDRLGLNFLYSPDAGDAPYSAGHYPTLLHGPGGGTSAPPLAGPVHLFGFSGADSLQLEWLGTQPTDNSDECEALTADRDSSDDGTVMPKPMFRGAPNELYVVIGYRDFSRYNATVPGRTLHFNAYFDYGGQRTFPGVPTCWWSGDGAATTSSSGNLSYANFYAGSPGYVSLSFQVTPPANALSGYARLRLDLGEDEGRVLQVSPSLDAAVGVAQFGEVEDYPFTAADVDMPSCSGPGSLWGCGLFATGYRVQRGDTLEIDAEGGFHNGLIDVPSPDGFNAPADPPPMLPTIASNALIGGIGRGPDDSFLALLDGGGSGLHGPGFVGSHFRGVVPDSGEVMLAINDAPLGDNMGHLYIRFARHGGNTTSATGTPARFALAGAFTNPARGDVPVAFSLDRDGPAEIEWLDVAGRRLLSEALGDLGPGSHVVRLRVGNALSPGVYWIRLVQGDRRASARVVFLR